MKLNFVSLQVLGARPLATVRDPLVIRSLDRVMLVPLGSSVINVRPVVLLVTMVMDVHNNVHVYLLHILHVMLLQGIVIAR